LDLLKNVIKGPRHTYEIFVAPDQRLHNIEFVQQVIALAEALQTQWQLQKGDKVALMFWNQPEFFVSFFALRLIGAVPVPINILMSPDDMAYVLTHADVKGILATEALANSLLKHHQTSLESLPFAAAIANAKEPMAPYSFEALIEAYAPSLDEIETRLERFEANPRDELAFLIYTSGTTGVPKGVMLSEHNILANLTGFQAYVNVRPDAERFLMGLPAFHCYGLICALFAFSERATILCVPRFNPKQILQFLETEAVTFLPLVPTMYTLVLQAAKHKIASSNGEKPFEHLHTCISGGAALSDTLLKAIESTLGVTVLEGYGLTETSPVIAVNSAERGAVAGAVGKPLPNVALRLVNHENGELIPVEMGRASAEGEIQVWGDSIMQGYYKNTEETEKVLSAEGWFKTGDLGYIDESGLLRISGGRLKDLIIRAGENIAPLPIERILLQDPRVAHVAVLPLKDERLGEAICACLDLNPDAKNSDTKVLIQELSALVREQLGASFIPDAYRFFDELPKNATGKIAKKLIQL
jgi:long-chain acyl-CoA synthetase